MVSKNIHPQSRNRELPELIIQANDQTLKIVFRHERTGRYQDISVPVGDEDKLKRAHSAIKRFGKHNAISELVERTMLESLQYEGKFNPSQHSGNCDYFPD